MEYNTTAVVPKTIACLYNDNTCSNEWTRLKLGLWYAPAGIPNFTSLFGTCANRYGEAKFSVFNLRSWLEIDRKTRSAIYGAWQADIVGGPVRRHVATLQKLHLCLRTTNWTLHVHVNGQGAENICTYDSAKVFVVWTPIYAFAAIVYRRQQCMSINQISLAVAMHCT